MALRYQGGFHVIQGTAPAKIPGEWERWVEERRLKGYMGETSKAKNRRIREGFFETYCPEDRSGVDIGCSDDPLNHTFRRWDITFGDGDATDMAGVPDETFFTVYASHVLEHLQYPAKAVRRWYEICKKGGHIIICVPNRDLYERKRFPPSNWNEEHKHFWLPDAEDPPSTKCLRKVILEAVPSANIVSYRTIDEGCDYTISKNEHPIGEYTIEAIIKK